jgi:hypothetical protein
MQLKVKLDLDDCGFCCGGGWWGRGGCRRPASGLRGCQRAPGTYRCSGPDKPRPPAAGQDRHHSGGGQHSRHGRHDYHGQPIACTPAPRSTTEPATAGTGTDPQTPRSRPRADPGSPDDRLAPLPSARRPAASATDEALSRRPPGAVTPPKPLQTMDTYEHAFSPIRVGVGSTDRLEGEIVPPRLTG